MELFIDSANIELIKKYVDTCPLKGVTTNPSIISRQDNQVFFSLLEEIQKVIGSQRVLMVQVIGSTYEAMIKDAQRIVKELGKEVFIKVPATLTGIKVIKTLTSEYYNVTATAIYSTFQGIVSLKAGAHYAAVYYNRMENLGLSAEEAISSISRISDNKSKIIGASFKNLNQVTKAYLSGAESCTLPPELLEQGLSSLNVEEAVNVFNKDWAKVYGDKTIADL